MILMMAAVVLLVMVEAARAQNFDGTPMVAQVRSNDSTISSPSNQAQILQVKMPQKSLARKIWDDTSLSYYQQFLGTNLQGGSETYNVFQEGLDSPGSGKAPVQSFHAVNLRHQINTNWAIGTTLSAVNGYSDDVVNRDRNGNTSVATGDTEFFNARAYVSLPAWRTSIGTLFTTLSYEHPTSNISKEDEMRWGWVAAQSFAFKLPDIKWNAGVMGQVYRIYYNENVKAPPFPGGRPVPLQTMIVSGGPYVNYRFNDNWMLGSIVTFDWDQRGVQSGSRDFNNNLSDRARATLTYFPNKIKYLQSVGLFTQALLKFRPDTTAVGADFAVRF